MLKNPKPTNHNSEPFFAPPLDMKLGLDPKLGTDPDKAGSSEAEHPAQQKELSIASPS